MDVRREHRLFCSNVLLINSLLIMMFSHSLGDFIIDLLFFLFIPPCKSEAKISQIN